MSADVLDFPTLRGWTPWVVPSPQGKQPAAGKRDPIFALAAQHRRLYAKLRPLEKAWWEMVRDVMPDTHRHKINRAAYLDLLPKVRALENQMAQLVATTPGALVEQIYTLRDLVLDSPCEPLVDNVIVGVRTLCGQVAPEAAPSGAPLIEFYRRLFESLGLTDEQRRKLDEIVDYLEANLHRAPP